MLNTREANELRRENYELRETIKRLTGQNTNRRNRTGRKEQVVELLKNGPMTIRELATELNITTKNVSSQLTYLRKGGEYDILTDKGGVKKLVERTTEPVVETEPEALLDVNELPMNYDNEDELDEETEDILNHIEVELSETV